jgi:hypothetical protein
VDEQEPLTDVFRTDEGARTGYLLYSCISSLQTLLDEGNLHHVTFHEAQDLVDLSLQIRRAVRSLKDDGDGE